MKIAIPVDDKSLESTVCQSFGRAPYFLIYDTEAEDGQFLENSATLSQGGAGVKAAQSIVDQNVSAVLAPRCGENAASVIRAAGIDIFKSQNKSARDNIDAYLAGDLPALDASHPGLHKPRG